MFSTWMVEAENQFDVTDVETADAIRDMAGYSLGIYGCVCSLLPQITRFSQLGPHRVIENYITVVGGTCSRNRGQG